MFPMSLIYSIVSLAYRPTRPTYGSTLGKLGRYVHVRSFAECSVSHSDVPRLDGLRGVDLVYFASCALRLHPMLSELCNRRTNNSNTKTHNILQRTVVAGTQSLLPTSTRQRSSFSPDPCHHARYHGPGAQASVGQIRLLCQLIRPTQYFRLPEEENITCFSQHGPGEH